MSPVGSLACLAAAVLAGCSTVQPYPIDWAPVVTSSDRKCPDLAGTFWNRGEDSNPNFRHCIRGLLDKIPGTAFCDSLAYNLLGDVGAGWGHGDIPDDAFLGAVTRIEQPSDDRLEVVIDGTVDEHGTTRVSLSASKGDFSCGPDGLMLRSRSGVTALGPWMSTERRSFRVAVDGTLVMKVQRAETALIYIVPFASDEESWVKWQRNSEQPISQEPVTQ